MRLIQYEYFEISDLPAGEIPYTAIVNALKDEKYLRRFKPTNYRNDLLLGHTGALLYWYTEYVDVLYDHAVNDEDFMVFFKHFPMEIREGFVFLFPEIMRKLNKVRKKLKKQNHLEEITL